MQIKYHIIYLLLCLFLLGLLIFNQKQAAKPILTTTNKNQENYYSVKSNKTFSNAAEDAAFAISERNFRITNTLRIGNAIRERGAKNYLDYDVILFCNIQYAKQVIDKDPHYINYCPGKITISEVSENQVIISTPLVPMHESNHELNQLILEINKLMKESVDFAAESWQQESG